MKELEREGRLEMAKERDPEMKGADDEAWWSLNNDERAGKRFLIDRDPAAVR